MSTRVVRSMSDFARHRKDVELVCGCGHKATLSWLTVGMRFNREGWGKSLAEAATHFRCSKCGGRPERIGPMER